jgi:hypothetical protein
LTHIITLVLTVYVTIYGTLYSRIFYFKDIFNVVRKNTLISCIAFTQSALVTGCLILNPKKLETKVSQQLRTLESVEVLIDKTEWTRT